eukprot:Lankesteria_metandrocarpae@DN755_c0_g1_i1.p1
MFLYLICCFASRRYRLLWISRIYRNSMSNLVGIHSLEMVMHQSPSVPVTARFDCGFYTLLSGMQRSTERRLINNLDIVIENVHLHLCDDHFAEFPFAFEAKIARFMMSCPKAGHACVSNTEAKGLKDFLLNALWIRFIGFELYFKEFDRPCVTDLAYQKNKASTARQTEANAKGASAEVSTPVAESEAAALIVDDNLYAGDEDSLRAECSVSQSLLDAIQTEDANSRGTYEDSAEYDAPSVAAPQTVDQPEVRLKEDASFVTSRARGSGSVITDPVMRQGSMPHQFSSKLSNVVGSIPQGVRMLMHAQTHRSVAGSRSELYRSSSFTRPTDRAYAHIAESPLMATSYLHGRAAPELNVATNDNGYDRVNDTYTKIRRTRSCSGVTRDPTHCPRIRSLSEPPQSLYCTPPECAGNQRHTGSHKDEKSQNIFCEESTSQESLSDSDASYRSSLSKVSITSLDEAVNIFERIVRKVQKDAGRGDIDAQHLSEFVKGTIDAVKSQQKFDFPAATTAEDFNLKANVAAVQEGTAGDYMHNLNKNTISKMQSNNFVGSHTVLTAAPRPSRRARLQHRAQGARNLVNLMLRRDQRAEASTAAHTST